MNFLAGFLLGAIFGYHFVAWVIASMIKSGELVRTPKYYGTNRERTTRESRDNAEGSTTGSEVGATTTCE